MEPLSSGSRLSSAESGTRRRGSMSRVSLNSATAKYKINSVLLLTVATTGVCDLDLTDIGCRR
mgnify:CR=1 FL=1